MKLLEMPYISINADTKSNSQKSNRDLFDLQIEDMNGAQIIKYIEDILKGAYKKDKYGNVIKLSSNEEKYLFAQDILNHEFAYNMIVSKLTPMEKKKLDNLLQV